MKEATLIYPHQLFKNHPALNKSRMVYLVEEPLFLTEFPTHAQKLLLHRLSMEAYAKDLAAQGYEIIYIPIQELPDTATVFAKIAAANITHLHIVDTTDVWLERRITAASQTHSLTLTRYESPLFLLPKAEAIMRYSKSKKHMARFYKQLRLDKKILLTDDMEPQGGTWSFDEDNRKKLPKNITLPEDITYYTNEAITSAQVWLATVPGEHYGEHNVWLPYTRKDATAWLDTFIKERLAHFGSYEDAMATDHIRLFHSTISPLLNIGLLTPQEVVEKVIAYGKKHNVGLNNVEGFVRQIIGWREFIRASYECDGSDMRTQNFWHHTRNLPISFWDGTTDILPLDIAITNALRFGYSHHIERLMVLGNFMLLTQTHPDQVYKWFMAMYVDAYDWVMVPNVYGMSQFADGGSFATKPYISGSSYIKKMSNYPSGDWEVLWTALYWNFIHTHSTFFRSNHRLSMMPKLWEKMTPEKRNAIVTLATRHFKTQS